LPNPYIHPNWLLFRKEIIELDNGCKECHRTETDGVILQVHHLEYFPGRLPWQYPYRLCECLCRGCHAQKHGIIKPSVGWQYVDREDLEDLSGNCDYCGTEIRHVFYIDHPNWEMIGVGEICCDNLTGTEIASNYMESQRRYLSRLKRFVYSTRWKEAGKIFTISQRKIAIQIHTINGVFRIVMNGHFGKANFQNIEDAKKRVFEVIENGLAEKFLEHATRCNSTK